MTTPKPRWGLALSGGAAYGLANIGVLDMLAQQGWKPDVVAGSSMGAIVGALYAFGLNTREMRDAASKMNWSNLARLSEKPLHAGLHSGLLRQELELHLRPLLQDATIGDCRIPFLCVAGRVKEPIDWRRIMHRGFEHYLRQRVERTVLPPETRLIDAISASSALPVVFSPVIIDGDEYVDLKSFWSIPSLVLRERDDLEFVIGTNTNPTHFSIKKILPRAVCEYIDAGQRAIRLSAEACDVIIQPRLRGGMHRFDKSSEFIAAGEEATRQRLAELSALLGSPQTGLSPEVSSESSQSPQA
jgi:NTE family protein